VLEHFASDGRISSNFDIEIWSAGDLARVGNGGGVAAAPVLWLRLSKPKML
jgi:hypothetical protein